MFTGGMSQPAPYPIARRSAADVTSDGETDARRCRAVNNEVCNQSGRGRTTAVPHSELKIAAAAQSVLRGQHEDQAVSRERPLRRRAAMIARPARVRIRNRKPCLRARRRLFGWNVLL